MWFIIFSLFFTSQASCVSSTILPRDTPPSFIYPGDASYGASTSNLSSILVCPYGSPIKSSKPILLVHGTGSTGEESYGSTYAPALHSAGYVPCYVNLPGRSAGDLQLTSSYVAYNLHYLSYLTSGKPVAAIGHSQGNPNIQWALRFFPSTRKVVSSYFGLAPDLGPGITSFRLICDVVGDVPWCDPAVWQQSIDSNYYAALNYRGHQTFVPTTTVWTETDEIVIPAAQNANITGATVISVQSICPLNIPDHFLMLVDSVAFALALDAFSHGGIADPSRIPRSVCDDVVAPGMNVTAASFAGTIANDLLLGNVLTQKVYEEPPLMPYAQIKNQ